MSRFAHLVTLLVISVAASKKRYLKSGNQKGHIAYGCTARIYDFFKLLLLVVDFVEVDITAPNQTVWVSPNATVVLNYKYGKTDLITFCYWKINNKNIHLSKHLALLKCANSTTTLRIGPIILRELNNSIFQSIVHLPKQPSGQRVAKSSLAILLVQCIVL